MKTKKLLQDGAKEGIHDAGAEEEVEDVAAEEGRGGVEEGAGTESRRKKSDDRYQMWNQKGTGKGSSINDVKQFSIIFDTPSPPPSSRYFSTMALVLSSQNP